MFRPVQISVTKKTSANFKVKAEFKLKAHVDTVTENENVYIYRSKIHIPVTTAAATEVVTPGDDDESRDIVDYDLSNVKVQVKYPKGFSMKARPSI